MLSFLKASVSAVIRRRLLWIVLNWLFFGAILVGAFFGQLGYGEFRVLLISDGILPGKGGWSYMPFDIFFFNLIVSGFVLLSLSGLVLFFLPVAFLLVRGLIWGVLLTGLPTPLFLASFPTLILEGEGHVLASVAGVHMGWSWLSPKRAYKGLNLSRSESLKWAFKDCVRIYVLVALFLFVAAVVEILTIILAF